MTVSVALGRVTVHRLTVITLTVGTVAVTVTGGRVGALTVTVGAAGGVTVTVTVELVWILAMFLEGKERNKGCKVDR